MKKRWWALAALLFAAFFACGFLMRVDHPDRLAALRPYAVEEVVRIQGAPMAGSRGPGRGVTLAKANDYGSRWHVLKVRGLSTEKIRELMNKGVEKESDWRPWRSVWGSDEMGEDYWRFKGAITDWDFTPSLQVYRYIPEHSNIDPKRLPTEEEIANSIATVTETEPLSRWDLIFLNMRYFGRPYGEH